MEEKRGYNGRTVEEHKREEKEEEEDECEEEEEESEREGEEEEEDLLKAIRMEPNKGATELNKGGIYGGGIIIGD